MKIHSIIIFSILFAAIVSCQSPQKDVRVYPISLTPLCRENILMSSPNALAIFDSVLAVKDSKMDSLVHLVDLRNNRYIGKQCPRGQGPNEFNLIMSMEAEKEGKSLLLYDPNPCALYRLARGSEGSIGLQRVYKNEKMREDMHWNIYPISGNRHLATGLYGEHQFCLLDSLGNIVDKFGEYPYRDEEERGLSGIIKSQVYQGDVTIAPSGKRFLSCTLCGDLVSIYEYNEATGYFQPKKNMYTTFPEYKYQGDNYFGVSRECPLTYLDATSTDDYIYLLYSGKTTQDVGLTAFYGNRIFVLNWEGEKVAELQCEQDLAALCLSPDGKTMYVIAYNPEPEVMYFRMPFL